jgi:hypothetical protein
VWVLVVENLLRGVASIFAPIRSITEHLPGTAAGSHAAAIRTVTRESTPGVLDILSRPASFVVLAIYIAGFGAAMVWLLHRRDCVL